MGMKNAGMTPNVSKSYQGLAFNFGDVIRKEESKMGQHRGNLGR